MVLGSRPEMSYIVGGMSRENHVEAASSLDAAAIAPTQLASGAPAARTGDDAAPLSTDSLPPRIGMTFGGYRLVELLGVGGSAAVYRGVHSDGSAAAIKVLHAWLSADPRAKRRFLREAAVANRLRHPAIVRMLAEGEDESGSAYLVMELAEGETVEARWHAANGQLPLAEVARITDELLSVLAVAHAAGVVHRDIKPANLLIVADGTLRVFDFGIARATELANAPSMVTRTGAVLGTALFMPPEQALGVHGEIDARSDVWAVAATMFALLTGQFVHRARTVNEALVLAATQRARSIRKVVPDLPRAVAKVIDRALSFDRADRYADAAAMQAALRQAMEGDGEATRDRALSDAPTLPEKVPSCCPPAMKAEDASAAGASAVKESAPPPRSRAAEATPRRRSMPLVVKMAIAALLLGAVAQMAGWIDVTGSHEARSGEPAPPPSRRAAMAVEVKGTAAEPAPKITAEPPPAALPSVRTVQVSIAPPDSTVDVAGQRIEVRDGTIQITGVPGSVHHVRAVSGGAASEADVVITENGPLPASVEVKQRKPQAGMAAGAPSRSATAAPTASAGPTVTTPPLSNTIDTDFDDTHGGKRPGPR
jgi:eukaryotic-like serine/threonine-protein kinase